MSILNTRYWFSKPFKRASCAILIILTALCIVKSFRLPEHQLPVKQSPLTETFPAAASARSDADLPPIPPWNAPPDPHVSENTPLLIGFTRNWELLQQVVVSYLTAGWPADDVYIVENTGTMTANRDGRLTINNPFFLDHVRLTKILGVHILSTPTYLTFSQLQNFYLATALEKGWEHFFWAHMDTAVLTDENYEVQPFKTLYQRAVAVLQESTRPENSKLAARWFSYDNLALVRTAVYLDVGGWDVAIPYYMSDCDMRERIRMHNYTIQDASVGHIFDVRTSLPDLGRFYNRGGQKQSTQYEELLFDLQNINLQNRRYNRKQWQMRQQGGRGEPFYRDPDGFQKGIDNMIDAGRKAYARKWGGDGFQCGKSDRKTEDDAWKPRKWWFR